MVNGVESPWSVKSSIESCRVHLAAAEKGLATGNPVHVRTHLREAQLLIEQALLRAGPPT